MNERFTPGPWVAVEPHFDALAQVSEDVGELTEVWSDNWLGDNCRVAILRVFESRADETLLVAAPELYAAVGDLLRLCDHWRERLEGYGSRIEGMIPPAVIRGRAALAKARGEAARVSALDSANG